MSDNFYNVVYPVKKEEIKYDSLEEIQKYQNILYIETLPVIIADFIQNNNMNAIIDLENEALSNEVRNVFDKEIFAKLSRDNKNILSEINENGKPFSLFIFFFIDSIRLSNSTLLFS